LTSSFLSLRGPLYYPMTSSATSGMARRRPLGEQSHDARSSQQQSVPHDPQPIGPTTPVEDQLLAMLGSEGVYTPSLCAANTFGFSSGAKAGPSSGAVVGPYSGSSSSDADDSSAYYSSVSQLSTSAASASASASGVSHLSNTSIPNHDEWRSKICEWCYRVIDHFRYDREIVSVAMNYFDRYLVLVEVELRRQEQQQLKQLKNQKSNNTATTRPRVQKVGYRRGVSALSTDSRDSLDGYSASYSSASSSTESVDSRTYQLAAMTALYLAVKLHADQIELPLPEPPLPAEQQQQQSMVSPVVQRNGSFSRRDSSSRRESSSRRGSTISASAAAAASASGNGNRRASTRSIPATPTAPTRKLRLSSFVELSRGQFSAVDITDMEKIMLNTLRWRVNPPTPMVFVSHLLRTMPTFVCGGGTSAAAAAAVTATGSASSLLSPTSPQPSNIQQDHHQDVNMVSPTSSSHGHGQSSSSSGSSSSLMSSESLGSPHGGLPPVHAPSSSPRASSASHPDAAKHRTLVLHVLHELSRYLTELSICLPDVSATYTPATIAFSAILISLDLLSTRTAVPDHVRQFYLSRIEALSGGRLTPHAEAVSVLKSKMCDSFVPDMLEDSLADLDDEGGDFGHPIHIARDAGLLSPDVERRCGSYRPQDPYQQQFPHSAAVEPTDMEFDPPRDSRADTSFDSDQLETASPSTSLVASVASFELDGEGQRHGHYNDRTVLDTSTTNGRNQSSNCVIEEAALQLHNRLSEAHLKDDRAGAGDGNIKKQSRQAALVEHLSEKQPGHVRTSSWMSDSSESPVSVLANVVAEAMNGGADGTGALPSSNGSAGSGKPPAYHQHHQQHQVTGYLL